MASDVQEVATELSAELQAPAGRLATGPAQTQAQAQAPTQSMAQQINSLGVDQLDARLRRLEGSMLRLEHLNVQLLQLLQKMVAGVSREDPP